MHPGRLELRSGTFDREGSLAAGAGRWSPMALGAPLLEWWTADRSDLITLNGAAVTSWRGVKNAYDATQGVSASRPVYSTSSFNGAPGVTFDGTDDALSVASQPFPSGNNGSEIYIVCQQNALVADTTDRWALVYGGATGFIVRRCGRGVSGGVNRARVISGNGSANSTSTATAGDMSGRLLLIGYFPASSISVAQDNNVASTPASVTQATGTTEVTIGSTTFDTGFWNGIIRDIIVTTPLSAEQAAQLKAWALPRRKL